MGSKLSPDSNLMSNKITVSPTLDVEAYFLASALSWLPFIATVFCLGTLNLNSAIVLFSKSKTKKENC